MLELAHSWPRSEGEYVNALNSYVINTTELAEGQGMQYRYSMGSEATHNPNNRCYGNEHHL